MEKLFDLGDNRTYDIVFNCTTFMKPDQSEEVCRSKTCFRAMIVVMRARSIAIYCLKDRCVWLKKRLDEMFRCLFISDQRRNVMMDMAYVVTLGVLALMFSVRLG